MNSEVHGPAYNSPQKRSIFNLTAFLTRRIDLSDGLYDSALISQYLDMLRLAAKYRNCSMMEQAFSSSFDHLWIAKCFMSCRHYHRQNVYQTSFNLFVLSYIWHHF